MKTKKKMQFAHWGFAMLLATSMATSVFAQENSGTDGFTITKPLEAAYVAVTDEGGTATLTFEVEGYDNISYQWYKSADGTIENSTAIEGATGSSYTTEKLAAKTSFYYYCVATAGEKSKMSNVTMVANTDLPTLYVNTPNGVEITSKVDWTDGTHLTLKDAGEKHNFENLTTEFRGRGNSTWLEPKKPYAIKVSKKEKREILGMPEHRRWVLIANYLDNSFLKNHVAFYLSEKLGMDYTVRGQFVNLVFNGVYRGLYWLGEAIKVDENRVKIDDGKKKMTADDDKDFLIEMDTHYDEIVRFHSSIRNMPYMVKNDDYMLNDAEDGISADGQARLDRFQDKIEALENLLYPDYGANDDCKANTNDCTAPDEAYKNIIDAESWAKFWLINEIMDNTELMGSAESDGPKSAYFTYQNKKEGDVFKAGPVWDFDAGAKTKDAPIKLDTTIYYNALFKSPSFVAAVKNVWANFATLPNVMSISAEVEKMTAELAVAAKLDSMRWGAHRDYVETTDLSFSGSVDFLKKALVNKVQVVNNFITKMVDLSTLTADYEAKDGDILTGKLAGNYKISIEDGAKVTLKNATIQGPQNVTGEWAGITCNGDCNIMLDGVNTVKGFSGHYSGIHVPVGKTLTIDGSGKLSASSGSDVDEYRTALAAGIGGGSYRADVSDMSCGNIVIKGGIITAAGGSSGGAGIGSGYYGISMERADEAATITIGKITISGGTVTATGGRYGGAGIGTGENYYGTFYLGDITISGGIVAATGGQSAAGIGVGEFPFGTAHLGDITITNGVKKVTVTKGNDECPGWLCAKHSVGIGYTSDFGGCVSFGKITIGDKETGFISESPFVYPTPIADFAAVQIYKYNNGITRAELDGNYGREGEATAINIPKDMTVNEVEFARSFPTGKFSTVVLPFDVNTSEVSGLDAVLRYNGIGSKDGKKAIKMKVVWATDKWVKDNNIKDDKDNLMHYDATGLIANTPYMMQMSNPTFKVNNKEPIVLTKTADAETGMDGWIFRGTWKYKKWAEGDPELGYAYGFAANASDDDKIQVGDFVKVGVGAWIRPMRAYLVRKDKAPAQGVRANGNYVMHPSIVQEELPELMSVIIGGDDGNEEQTTVIGHFNTRTGEFKMNRSAGDRTFDLKGRYVGDKANRARGAYYGKRVLK